MAAMKRISLLCVVLLWSMVEAPTVHACSCNMADAATEFERAAAVFEGRVLDVQTDESSRTATFRVTQTWKGADAEEVVVSTHVEGSMCGVAFEEGTVWLIYGEGSGDHFYTDMCHRTRLMDEEARDETRAFGAGVTPVDPLAEQPVDEDDSEPPARGGCASCASTDATSNTLWGLLVFAVVMGRSRLRR